MQHLIILRLLLLSLSSLAATAKASTSTVRCHNLTIPLSITATVRQFPSNFDPLNFNFSTASDFPPTTVSGDYNIAASYCEPSTTVGLRAKPLQILVHGATYTRNYWSGLITPTNRTSGNEYSWIDYAASRGYATLAIDRLCNGESSYPKGTLACQVENQVAVLKALVDDARAGGLVAGKRFDNITVVGHSYGSSLTQGFIRMYPDAVNQVILTGFSTAGTQVIQALADSGGFSGPPANQVDPARFGSLDDNYFVLTNETGLINSFFYGKFSRRLAEYNFRITGAYNVYEAASIAIAQSRAERYTGDVIVLNGQNDAAACGGNCGQGESSPTATASSYVPNARNYRWHNTAETGHCLSLHYTARQSYRVIFDYLQQLGN